MTRSTLEELLARCERATGPDREIDVSIHEASGLPFEMEYWADYSTWQTRNLSKVPPYTSSIDAIVGLIERELPETNCRGFDLWEGGCDAYVSHNGSKPHTYFGATASTPALALCAAFLKAKLSSPGGDE